MRCGRPASDGMLTLSAELRLRPELFWISARSSISITTVRMSPRLAARRSATSEFCDVVHSEAALSGRLAAEQADRAAAGEGQGRALAPLVGALLEAITPLAARTRLEAALLAELRQLAGSVTPLSARLRCGADMAVFAAACLAATGVEAIAIDPSGPEGTVEAELLGGTIAWDVAAVAEQLRALVHEIMETE